MSQVFANIRQKFFSAFVLIYRLEEFALLTQNPRDVKAYGIASAVNLSEERVFAKVLAALEADSRATTWRVYFNLELPSFGPERPPKNIDIVIVSDAGIWVAELKSYSRVGMEERLKENHALLSGVNSAARIVASKVKGAIGQSSGKLWIQGRLVFESDARRARTLLGTIDSEIQGVRVEGLDEFVAALTRAEPDTLTRTQIEAIGSAISPHAIVKMKNEVTRFRRYSKLHHVSDEGRSFHRVYKGIDSSTSRKVELHLYDVGWRPAQYENPEEVARRECDVLVALQKLPYVPRILETYADDPDNPGEVAYMVLDDLSANRPLASAKTFQDWSIQDRIEFSRLAFEAIDEIHSQSQTFGDSTTQHILHRNISAQSLRAQAATRTPLFAQFSLASIDSSRSVVGTSGAGLSSEALEYAAPEVGSMGIVGATKASDTYSLAKTLLLLFHAVPQEGREFEEARAKALLEAAIVDLPLQRPSARRLADDFKELCAASALHSPVLEIPDPELWDESTVIHLPSKPNQQWVVSAAVGTGAEFKSFRVRRILPDGTKSMDEALIKVPISDHATLLQENAFALAQTLNIRHVQQVYEVADQLTLGVPSVLLEWVPGFVLRDASYCLAEFAEEAGKDPATVVTKWLQCLLEALRDLHARGYCFCDVSPGNIVIDGLEATFIDLAGIAKFPVDNPIFTPKYRVIHNPDMNTWGPLDDVLALGACFSELILRAPAVDMAAFSSGQADDPLNPLLAGSRGRAVEQVIKRLLEVDGRNSEEMITEALLAVEEPKTSDGLLPVKANTSAVVNPHLMDLLTVYAGSNYGNAGARGLDGAFSHATYVQSELDDWLIAEVRSERKNLILLFGNAGDGKTAFLQFLIHQLTGDDPPRSATRIYQYVLPSGTILRINFDGSASFNGRSSLELQNDIFQPFLDGISKDSPIHILAINSGPLMDWIEQAEEGADGQLSWLAGQLSNALSGKLELIDARIALINLNERSLVGGNRQRPPSTSFLESLINLMVESNLSSDPWEVCNECSAKDRCVAIATVNELRRSNAVRVRLVERVTRALQAVHLAQRIHVTARELKGAISFLLFGSLSCQELHNNSERIPLQLHDRLFASSEELGENRQGQLLEELQRFDPAWTSRPLADRLKPPGISINSFRRKQYLDQETGLPEWQRYDITGGEYFQRFIEVLMSGDDEKRSLTSELLRGLSRIDDLPSVAELIEGAIPFRIDTQTVTEMAFWTTRPVSEFSVQSTLAGVPYPFDTLPTTFQLIHSPLQGSRHVLDVSLELFTMLLRLGEHVHLPPSGLSSGLLANLRVFLGRILARDEMALFCHDPNLGDDSYAVKSFFDGERTVISIENLGK